ncbi:hypothetical protein [Pseudonocardia asaccharolytica]|uniref:Integral membrane protein n=1 Tax=Pseudonocardia asaccharolytica DSM 44247 = NBRC 16224 TaxID=1123024 RepID=A0A511D1Z3_9PSEU|nr:hypothetical protein [Pseudonocardia asaccharolytica]GEL18707.1 hypothetical protein PA7_25440 [Pseudonocardia asaccharolytica DSM 44247 = NBRC 16224]
MEIHLVVEPGRLALGWLLLAFLVTFLVTRGITRLIRVGRGPFRNARLGGVHVHHQVPGIFLMMVAGAGEFTYRPDAPWLHILAAAFGVGAALTLDEFALWLHLEDVYWAEQGRKSIDAVLAAAAIGALLLLGATPFVDDPGAGGEVVAATIVLGLLCSTLAIAKGKAICALIGILLLPVSLVAAVRLAKPDSPWARWRYPDGSRRRARSLSRYPPDHRTRWDVVKDILGGAPNAKQP